MFISYKQQLQIFYEIKLIKTNKKQILQEKAKTFLHLLSKNFLVNILLIFFSFKLKVFTNFEILQ